MTALSDGFWMKVDKTSTCWLWTGSISHDGYGRCNFKNHGTSLPHRVTYIDTFGSIPNGLEIDHLCSTRNCVRPDHLEVVTHEENCRRAMERRTECRNGHPYTETNRVTQYDKDGDRCLECRRTANRDSIRRMRAKDADELGQVNSWSVRLWAWSRGMEVAGKGPISRKVMSAYLAASMEDAA